MFSSFIAWFDSLSFVAVLSVAIVIIIVENFIYKTVRHTPKLRKWLLINIWQVFGVLLPVMWLLRASENYIQVVPLAIMIVFFGVYKPTRLSQKN